MKIKSYEWMESVLNPILLNFNAEIFGGCVRDYVAFNKKDSSFKDIDISVKAPYSPIILNDFMKALRDKDLFIRDRAQGSYLVPNPGLRTEVLSTKELYRTSRQSQGVVHRQLGDLRENSEDPFKAIIDYFPVKESLEKDPIGISKKQPNSEEKYALNKDLTRSKLKIMTADLESVEIDLVWGNKARVCLDADIHALYFDRYFNVCIYDDYKYRYALENAKKLQFIKLDSSPYRITKLKAKGFTEFVRGQIGDNYEDITTKKRYEEFYYMDSSQEVTLKDLHSNEQILSDLYYDRYGKNYTNTCKFRNFPQDKTKLMVLVPKKFGWEPSLEESLLMSSSELLQYNLSWARLKS